MENCFLCQRSIHKSLQASRTSSIYSKWKESCAKSLCQLLELNLISFQDKFLQVKYCTTCLQIIRDIDFSLKTVNRLGKRLTRSRKTVEALLKESFQKIQARNWIKQEVILPHDSLNSDDQFDNSAEYSYMINAIFDWTPFSSNSSEDSFFASAREPSDDKIPGNSEGDLQMYQYEELTRDSRLQRTRSTPTYRVVDASGSESEPESDCDSDFMPTAETIIGDEVDDSEDEILADSDKETKKLAQSIAASPRKIKHSTNNPSVRNKNKNTKLIRIRSLASLSRPKRSSADGQVNHPKLVCNFDKNCRFATTRRIILEGHVNEVHKGDPTPFHCPDCAGTSDQSKFSSITRYYCHRREVHQADVSNFPCDTCKKTYRTKWELRRHFKMTHVKRPSPKLRCSQCKKLFDEDRKTELEEHEELHKLQISTPFSCVICNTQDFTNFHDLSIHVNQEHEDLLKCEICSRTYNTEKLLNKHVETAHGEKRRIFKCPKPDCPFIGRCRTTLGRHIETHSPQKNYACDQCPKEYKSKSCLTYHIRAIHRKELKWQCKLCPKSFAGSAPLKAHEESHNTTKNYFCEKCGKAFRTKKNLAQHMRSHSETNKIPRQAPRKQRKPKAQNIMNTLNNKELQAGNSSDAGTLLTRHPNPDFIPPVPINVPGSSWSDQQYLSLSHNAQLQSRQYATLDLSQGSSYHAALQQQLHTISSHQFPFPH